MKSNRKKFNLYPAGLEALQILFIKLQFYDILMVRPLKNWWRFFEGKKWTSKFFFGYQKKCNFELSCCVWTLFSLGMLLRPKSVCRVNLNKKAESFDGNLVRKILIKSFEFFSFSRAPHKVCFLSWPKVYEKNCFSMMSLVFIFISKNFWLFPFNTVVN